MRPPVGFLLFAGLLTSAFAQGSRPRSWTADNGNRTYSKPLFYDEFSDRDMIRVGAASPAGPPCERSDDFYGKLKPVWQWNHTPDDTKRSLTERAGRLRQHSLPAKDFWTARNTLTQRAIGPESTVTTALDASGMKPGDVAGLGLLNLPYAWIGVERAPALLSYSVDGKLTRLDGEFTMLFQLGTFQGIRYGLLHYNSGEAPGGHADCESFDVYESRPRGLTRAIPVGRTVTFASMAEQAPFLALEKGVVIAGPVGTPFKVIDVGRGRIALRPQGGGLVSVGGDGAAGPVTIKKVATPGDAETFQWVDLRGETPDRKDGRPLLGGSSPDE